MWVGQGRVLVAAFVSSSGSKLMSDGRGGCCMNGDALKTGKKENMGELEVVGANLRRVL